MDPQTIFDTCKLVYKKMLSRVRMMAETVSSLDEVDLDSEQVIIDFDIILQYSLLQIAVADYELDNNEIIFIRDLTEEGDFVEDLINERFNRSITWESIYGGGALIIKDLLSSLKSEMTKISNDFVWVVALFDTLTPEHNYVEEFEKMIWQIFGGVSIIDGQLTNSEKRAVPLLADLVDMIKDKKEDMENTLKKDDNE